METLFKTVELLICSSNNELFKIWEETENCNSEYTPEVRGLLMDELSRRDPEGFNNWLLSQDGKPDKYIKKCRPAVLQEWLPSDV